MKEKKATLKREIGLFGLSANIINIVIGAGIFVLPAIVAAGLGAASIFAYVFCGILITLTMLCYAEVGSKITETGGVYTYIEKTFGKYPGFLTFFLFLFTNITGTAAVGNAIMDIIFGAFPSLQSELVRVLFFLFLFSALAYVNVIGLKQGVGLVKIVTFLKLVPLLLIVFLGFEYIEISNLNWETTPSIAKIGETSLVLFFAFTGAESALSVSGEIRNPNRTTPRAILLSTVIVTIIYILIQTVSQGVLGPSLPSFSDNPLGMVADRIFGPIGFTLLTIGAAVSMFGNVSSKVLSTPRVLFAASKDEVIPLKVLSKVHSKYITPHVAIIAYAILCFVFALLGEFKQLAIISSATSLLISLGISVAAIKLRVKKSAVPNAKTFRIPGGYTVPILSSIAILWFLSKLSMDRIYTLIVFVVILSSIYFLFNSKMIKRLGKK